MRLGRAVATSLLLLTVAALRTADADEGVDEAAQAGTPDAGPPLTIDVDTIVQVEEVSSDAEGKAFAILGSLVLERRGVFSIRAQRAMIWLDPRVDTGFLKLLDALKGKQGALPLWAVRAIYAEGGRAPAIFQAGGQVVRATSLFYDFQRHEGLFLDAELRLRRRNVGPLGQDLPDLVARAERFRATGPGSWSGRDVAISSTDYVKPEVELRVRELEIHNDAIRAALGKIMVLSARDSKAGTGPTTQELEEVADSLAEGGMSGTTNVELRGVRAHAFGMPFFGWRRLEFAGNAMDSVIARVTVGNKGSIGNGVYAGFGKKTRPLGWYLGAGYFEGRGPLVDNEIFVDAWGGRLSGRSVTSYFNDGGTDFDGTTPSSRHRYWTSNRYRFQWTPNLRFDMEVAALSDPNYLRIYDERELKEGKDQETLGYLRYRNRALFATFIYRWRTISFQEEKQQLPAGGISVPSLNLLRLGEDGQGRPIVLQMAVSSRLGNLSYRQAEGSAIPDFRTVRFDVDPRLFVAFNLGAVRVTPFAAFRFTGYEEGLNGSSEGRYAGTGGIRADMQFGRWFGDVQHLINLVFEYENMYDVTVPPDLLYQMDDIDRIAEWSGFGVRMRNRFLRRTPNGLRQFLNFELYGTWFPEDKAPLGIRTAGFLELDLEWFPSLRWLVEMRGQYNWDENEFATASVGGRYMPREDLRFFGAFSHLQGDSDVLTGGTEFQVDKRWRMLLFTQWDIRDDGALDQALLIQRMGKSFLIGANIRYRVGEDRFTISFKFDLLEAFRSDRRKTAEEELRREVFFPSGP